MSLKSLSNLQVLVNVAWCMSLFLSWDMAHSEFWEPLSLVYTWFFSLIGLYLVLWGKDGDEYEIKSQERTFLTNDEQKEPNIQSETNAMRRTLPKNKIKNDMVLVADLELAIDYRFCVSKLNCL